MRFRHRSLQSVTLDSSYTSIKSASGRKSRMAPERSRRLHCAVCETLENRLLLSTYTVTNTGNSGAGSLRQAILNSNADTTATNTIDFNIAAAGVQTISPLSQLPTITHAVNIDGTTEAGYAGSPVIVIKGVSAGTSSDGLLITANNTTVTALDIDLFSGNGIEISGASNVTVSTCYIGIDVVGNVAQANENGIELDDGATGDTIGGSTAGTGNVISGNLNQGVELLGESTGQQTDGNVVVGNYIGTDYTGTSALANGDSGVLLAGGATNNTIGGTDAAQRNVISGNTVYGVEIDGTSSGPQTINNTVEGNYIGTDAAGTAALPNANGVFIDLGAQDNTIGGLAAGAGNLISGNYYDGIIITGTTSGPQTTGNVVEGNYIGTDYTGTAALGDGYGIFINGHAQDNTIGGTAAGARNLISGNSIGGIEIDGMTTGPSTSGNVVEGNYIGTDYTGTTTVANTYGVLVDEGAEDNTIGGTTAGAGNIISGNTGDGVEIGGYPMGPQTSGNVLEGNYIGTDVTGSLALGNGIGVLLDYGAQDNTIGGTSAGARNVISGNSEDGVEIDGTLSGPQTSSNVVEGNYVGTDYAGSAALANHAGVLLDDGAQDNTIGGTAAGAGNLVSGNSVGGVEIIGTISGPETSGNVVEGNYIGTNYTGTSAIANSYGVLVDECAEDNTVGGTTAGARNVISGNGQDGVEIGGYPIGPLTTGNVLEGNYIGTDVTGSLALGNGTGVLLDSGAQDNTIGGTTAGAVNLISGNTNNGIEIDGNSNGPNTTGNLVEGNSLGTDVTGSHALGNGIGVLLDYGAQNNTIGGTAAGSGNLVSANTNAGVEIEGSSSGPQTTGNLVQGNYLGTNAAGSSALGNFYGVLIEDGAQTTTIGGTTAGARNIISGNVAGVEIEGSAIGAQTTGNVVEGNYIGTDATGAIALGNMDETVYITNGAQDNTIGGITAGARNIISGNSTASGIMIFGTLGGPQTSDNLVEGNYIGTDVTGAIALGNAYGVFIANGAQDNIIGGTVAAVGNLIAYNAGPGVVITGSGTINNPVRLNSIFDNGGLGIDLGDDGVTPNDPGDADTGPDDLQNFPVLTQAIAGASGTFAQGSLNSTPNTLFAIDLYSNPGLSAGGTLQGRTYVGSTMVSTDAFGNGTFKLTLATPVAPGTYLTATTTTTNVSPYGDTSEFAAPIAVVGSTPVISLLTPTINLTATGGVYTGLPQPASATVTGAGNAVIGSATLTYYTGSTVTGTPLASAPTNVGTYTVLAGFAGTSTYSPASTTDTFHITAAPLVITANNQTRAYGATNPSLTVSYSGLVDAQTPAVLTTQPTVSTTATATSPIGPYAITVSGAATANYSIAYVPGTLTVTAAAATKLVFTTEPVGGTAGTKLSQIVVTIEDQYGDVETGDNSTVVLGVNSGGGGFLPGSTTSVSAVGGVAKFTNLTLDSTSSYTLDATDSADAGISTLSNKFYVAPDPPVRLSSPSKPPAKPATLLT